MSVPLLPIPPNELAALAVAWAEGAREFNRGRYWHAHERWEVGWVRLPQPLKSRVQALIQLAAVFHLLGLGRRRAALALCASALAKLRLSSVGELPRPCLEVRGAEAALERVAAGQGEGWESIAAALEARLRWEASFP